ncbi:MAG: tRNA pseudouridine(38-40) synthase TruA [Sulfurospirillum sp.]|nr:MAG: tRNA pseudouridine(38-40) synthase TruA [Sulfurospirillum sp.]
MRVKMTLSYDGSHFYGFQVQNSGVTTVANRLYAIFRSLGIDGAFEASGRTDRGVHATGQVVGIDIPPFWQKDLMKLREHINRKALPHIFIHKIEEVADDFHARYDAKRRTYRYIVSDREPSVFLTPYRLFTPPFDAAAIHEAITLFEGEHDFSLFARTGSDTVDFVRRIYRVRFYHHEGCYLFGFEANGYLRSQIRLMVSFLLKIGYGKVTKEDLKDQLLCKREVVREPVAPNGLYLTKIRY